MCFSAGASFTSSVVLSVIGTGTLRKVQKPSQVLFACISVFFAFQQFTEGILWKTIGQEGYAGVQMAATYVFLIMAEVIWPIIIPFSVLLMEENIKRKKILFGLLAVGVGIAFYYLRHIVICDIHAEINGRHIVYLGAPKNLFWEILATFIYLVATMAPLFVSTIKRTNIFGIIMGLSFLVSALFYRQYLTSVWCFFAALISFVVYYIIRDAREKYNFAKQAEV